MIKRIFFKLQLFITYQSNQKVINMVGVSKGLVCRRERHLSVVKHFRNT